jgi:hypothetical protein
MLKSDLVAGLPSRILDPGVFTAWVNLFLQKDDSAGQPVGGHVDSSQATLFQETYLVGQRRNMGEFKGIGSSLHAPEIQGVGLQKEGSWVRGSHSRTTSRAIPEEKSSSEGLGSRHEGGFGDHASDNLAVSSARLRFQEKIVLQ